MSNFKKKNRTNNSVSGRIGKINVTTILIINIKNGLLLKNNINSKINQTSFCLTYFLQILILILLL